MATWAARASTKCSGQGQTSLTRGRDVDGPTSLTRGRDVDGPKSPPLLALELPPPMPLPLPLSLPSCEELGEEGEEEDITK